MNFQEFNSYLAPIGLILAGVVMKLSKNNVMFGKFKKYWWIDTFVNSNIRYPNSADL
jgi:hypothetical protein